MNIVNYHSIILICDILHYSSHCHRVKSMFILLTQMLFCVSLEENVIEYVLMYLRSPNVSFYHLFIHSGTIIDLSASHKY